MSVYRDRILIQLRDNGIDPDSDRKDQHFMVCEEVIRAVVDSAFIGSDDFVLEIGPGIGQLSRSILKRGARLVAIEIDRRFKEILEDVRREYPDRFEVLWGSALDVRWPTGVNKIVMNPPFSILEPLLKLLYQQKGLELVSMIIGKRYCDSAMQRPGSRGFNISSLMTQARFSPKRIMDVKKEDFYPPAGERCAVITLNAEEKPNRVLRLIADFLVDYPAANLRFVVNQALELLNKNARKYRQVEKMMTARSVGLDASLLNKRLQDITNLELAKTVQKLTSLFNKRR